MAAFGVATLVGVGYVIGKKIAQKMREDEEDLYDIEFDGLDDLEGLMDEDGIDVGVYVKECKECKEGYSDKIKKASLFAVGAIKTGADKFGETIQDIKSKDMVKKGEETVHAMKETGDNIKNDIKREVEDLKCMVKSINEEDNDNGDELFANTTENVVGDEKAAFNAEFEAAVTSEESAN
jgi:hypothetical protein